MTTLDLIFTNLEYCASSGVVNLHISDHTPVFVIKKKPRDTRGTVSFKGRSYVNYSKELLSDCLTNKIKEVFRDSRDLNICWNEMEAFLENFLNRYCPIKTFRSKDNSPAWLTHDIITLSRDRDRAWRDAIRTNIEEDWATARRLRNWANNAIKAAKSDFLQNELTMNKSDPKKFWRNIKGVLPDQESGSINIKNPITNDTLDRDAQAQVINDFFANIGEKLAVKFGDLQVDVNIWPPHEGDKLQIRHITQIEVLKLIDSISIFKSSGLDNIGSKVLKDFMTLASREVTQFYNDIIDTGIFPDKWKIATVTPIPKVPHAANPTDLRPISLLPIPGKLFEKYITAFFSDKQNGFRKGKSTGSAMAKLLDDVASSLNESKICLAAYLDVQKAFDTVNNNILLTKLRASGIGDNLCSLLQNYLSNRKQKTKLHNTVSDTKNIRIGVPQGSIIGPIMFIIYINDIPDVLNNSEALMYADDTVLYTADACKKVVRKKLQGDLASIEKWCLKNRLSLNVSKTKIMTFMSDHKRKTMPKFKFYMKGSPIEEVESYKYLGTNLDNRLSGDLQFPKQPKLLALSLGPSVESGSL